VPSESTAAAALAAALPLLLLLRLLRLSRRGGGRDGLPPIGLGFGLEFMCVCVCKNIVGPGFLILLKNEFNLINFNMIKNNEFLYN
jgi:hypothetical protein